MWKFWIDVGGTFTDTLAVSPEGSRLQSKVLSSGLTKGSILRIQSACEIVSDSFGDAEEGFWNGVTLRVVDAEGQAISSHTVESFSLLGDLQKLSVAPLIDACNAELAQGIELDAGVHAPIIAIRRLIGVPFADPLPDCDVRLGTTRGTNALLTRTGANVGLLTSEGFADLLDIGDQARANLFALTIEKPAPLYSCTVAISERVLADGTIDHPLDEENVRMVLARMKSDGISAVAVCLMHSFRYPEHELRVGKIAAEIGFEEIRLSHQVAPLIKIVPRAETTVLDAYLNPVIGKYLDEITDHLSAGSQLRMMTSSGGLVTRENFSGKDSVLSGPAGGVVGAARIGMQAGFEKVIGFDMGGTSTDVSRFDGNDGEFEVQFESRKAGVRIMTPMLAIETVAAGGGSVCWFDGVRLRVGPSSAGSDPGPACYRRGGPLTVTDMNLFLGRIQTDLFPFALDSQAVHRKLELLCLELSEAGFDYSAQRLAEGFLEIANHNMASAIESVSVAKGYDPKEYALMSFGGAGAQHCCAVADLLGMTRILDHPQSAILSAVGISMADQNAHVVKSILQPADQISKEDLRNVFVDLKEEAVEKLFGAQAVTLLGQANATVKRRLELRYLGLDGALVVDSPDIAQAAELFEAKHLQFYGYTQDRAIEVVAARVQVVAEGQRPERMAWPTPVALPSGGLEAHRQGGKNIQRSQLSVGDQITGPASIADSFSTTVIDAGWRALVGPETTLKIEKVAQPTSKGNVQVVESLDRADPIELEIFNRRFSSIAAQMGLCLQKTSVSVNVKERLDFSCAIFTHSGDLVVNAPHIPVHLGAMSETVREIIRLNPSVGVGDVFITNDPYGGGSHLPDVTVVSPVFINGKGPVVFWVASRSHHAEIGGKTPGSMPPDATCLAEEGVLIANLKLVDRGVPQFERLEKLLDGGPYPSRNSEENLADVQAQIAANQSGSRDLEKLVEGQGLSKVRAYMGFIQDAAAAQVGRAIGQLPDGVHRFCDSLDNGATIRVAITVSGRRIEIDFAGTDEVLAGNQNANPAIVNSAVMYVLRLLIDSDIPLNEGVMNQVAVHIPPNCFLNPTPGESPETSPAIVGGNVETSQRVVDVLLGALGIAAASQGTMNNWLMGDESFGYYETVGGGSGATETANGADAVHVHMTNTRLTDPEILETRYPVILREFSIRTGSGGAGQHRGGNGMIRAIEFLKSLDVSLLTNRRSRAPYGLAGGDSGAAGKNTLIRESGEEVALESKAQLKVEPGDVLRIETPGGGGYGS
jgi:5-oxoprolinase (ATP-hydrolysing)